MDWKEIFSTKKSKSILNQVLNKINHFYKISTVYPDREDIFRAFKLTPFEDIKVVILGQDPYINGEADGLAFSTRQKEAPGSLKNIIQEIKNEYPSYVFQNSYDLSSWAKQGVFLLNTILTVEKGSPASHRGIGWEIFTDYIIETISKERKYVVFLLWGNYARSKKNIILANSSTHLILEAFHPSPLAASRGFFGCNHFKLANEFLQKNGKNQIDWRIP